MKLGTLLDEIRFGKEFIESKNTVDILQNLIDEDYNLLLVSKRIDQLLKECDTTQSFIKKLARAARSYKEYEDKILEGNDVSSIYARMKIDSITEDIDTAIVDMEKNKKVLRESNQVNIGKTIATLKYGLKVLSESKNIPLKKTKEMSTLLESYTNREIALLQETL